MSKLHNDAFWPILEFWTFFIIHLIWMGLLFNDSLLEKDQLLLKQFFVALASLFSGSNGTKNVILEFMRNLNFSSNFDVFFLWFVSLRAWMYFSISYHFGDKSRVGEIFFIVTIIRSDNQQCYVRPITVLEIKIRIVIENRSMKI